LYDTGDIKATTSPATGFPIFKGIDILTANANEEWPYDLTKSSTSTIWISGTNGAVDSNSPVVVKEL
jgi:hypothetical protein